MEATTQTDLLESKNILVPAYYDRIWQDGDVRYIVTFETQDHQVKFELTEN